jgi:hypothetical protein|tara:strand:- start:2802 stop:4577 length:1776 start_codon:yes stop_codon:yes gene_type:complete
MSYITQDLAASADGVWLLDATIDGRVYRYTSAADDVDVTSEDGHTLVYLAGMAEVRATSAEAAAAIQIMDPSTDWAGLFAAGASSEGGSAVLRRWWPTLTLPQSVQWASGAIRGVEWGARGEPLVFSIEMADEVDTEPLLPLNARAHSPLHQGDGSGSPALTFIVFPPLFGSPFPIVIGYPGEMQDSNDTVTPVVPCLLTDFFNARSPQNEASRCVVSVGRIAATSVYVTEADRFALGPFYPTATIATDIKPTHDGAVEYDFAVSYFAFGGTLDDGATSTATNLLPHAINPSLTDAGDDKAAFLCGFKESTGGGIVDTTINATVSGVGDVIIWAMRQASGQLLIDWEGLYAVRERLNARYRWDGFINDPTVTALAWLRSEVLGYIPVMETTTARGWSVSIIDWAATEDDAIGSIVADVDAYRSSGCTHLNADQIVNHVTVVYRPGAKASGGMSHDGYLSQVTVTPDLYYKGNRSISGDIDNASYPHRIAQHSAASFGVRKEEIKALNTWDDATALNLAIDTIMARALPVVSVTYLAANDHLERASVGDVFTLSDSELGWDGRIAIVLEVAVGGGEPTAITFGLPDPSLRNP